MALTFCIPKVINRKLKAAIDSGEVSVDRLLKMSSEEMGDYLRRHVGDDYAQEIADRFARRFNTELTVEQVDYITKILTQVDDLRAKQGYAKKAGEVKEWARIQAELDTYMENIVNRNNELGFLDTVKYGVKEELQKIKDQETVFAQILQGGKSLLGAATSPFYKSIKAAIDASFMLRQGFKVFTKSPETWWKNNKAAWEVLRTVSSKKKMDAIKNEFKATLLSQKNYDTLVNDGKLAVNVIEDWFPTTLGEKIPYLGNLFKSSNEAFTIFSQGARFDIANEMLERAIKSKGGQALTKEEVRAIAHVANSVTGRGSLGRLEPVSGALNKLFFSARFVRSQADTFVMPINPSLTPFARREALLHSRNTLGAIAALMATASMFGEVEWDPLSTKFGKLRVGDSDNYIDLTAGLGSYITLAARNATGKYVTSSGKEMKLNTGEFGAKTRGDILSDWAVNKLAPAPGVINSVFLRGEMYGGEEPTIENVARGLVAPISVDNIYDFLTQEDLQTALILSTAELLGAGTTQYQNR